MNRDEFAVLIAGITETLADRPLDTDLHVYLNQTFPPDSPAYTAIRAACEQGIAEGWMCEREAGGIRYGRVIKPSPITHGFSVDVVLMNDCKGPHHRHPTGEIDLIMPRTAHARFDGHGAGWCVYGPDSAHYPTVSAGEAIVLYLLPQGAIEFTRQ